MTNSSLPALPPPAARPGCVPTEVAQVRVQAWLEAQGLALQGVGVGEELSAAAWLRPELAEVIAGIQAWLTCLSGPDWSKRSIEEIHRTASARWPEVDQHAARRRLVAELEGGLEGPSPGGAAWGIWLPTAAGGFVVYDGTGPAQWVAERGE